MKKITSMLFVILMAFVACMNAYALSSSEKEQATAGVVSDARASQSAYITDMEDILNQEVAHHEAAGSERAASGGMEAYDIVSYDIKGAYQVNILEPLLVTALQTTGSFADAVTDTVQWKIPVTLANGSPGLATIVEGDDGLTVAGVAIDVTSPVGDAAIVQSVAQSAIMDQPPASLQITHSYLYNTTFVYLCNEEGEYLIPYSDLADTIGLKNGSVYTVAEITKIFNKHFDETQLSENPDQLMGSAPFRQQPVIPVWVAIPLLVASFAGIVVLFVHIRNLRRSRSK